MSILVAEKNKTEKSKETPAKEEPSSLFQRQRVDMLLGDLLRKYPLPLPQFHQTQNQSHQNQNGNTNSNNTDGQDGVNIKQEPGEHASNNPNEASSGMLMQGIKEESRNDMKPPPEKKIKM